MVNRDDLKNKLVELGIEFNKQWKTTKLEELLKESMIKASDNEVVEEINIIEEEVSEKVEKNSTIQELRKNAIVVREMTEKKATSAVNNRKVKNNRIGKIYKKIEKDNHDVVEIWEVTSGKHIRNYSIKDHGEDYKRLADKFLSGRNYL